MEMCTNPTIMKMTGLGVLPKWNRKVTSSKSSGIILRSFRAILVLKFTIKIAPRPPRLPNWIFPRFPGFFIGNRFFWCMTLSCPLLILSSNSYQPQTPRPNRQVPKGPGQQWFLCCDLCVVLSWCRAEKKADFLLKIRGNPGNSGFGVWGCVWEPFLLKIWEKSDPKAL